MSTPTLIQPINFLNVDLDIESHHPLDPLVDDLGDEAFVLHHGKYRGLNVVRIELSYCDPAEPETAILRVCELIERLEDDARAAWDNACTRTFDLGYESGNTGPTHFSMLHPATIQRVAALGASIAITIYPIPDETPGAAGATPPTPTP